MQSDQQHERDDGQRAVARSLIRTASPEQRSALYDWALELRTIRESQLTKVAKARAAVQASANRDVIVPLLKHIPAELKSVGLRSRRALWDDRGWPARLGLIGVTIGVSTFGGKAAGIATMGRGVGVPLWAVLGASGTFLGTLIEELSPAPAPRTTYSVIDAERTPARTPRAPGPDA